MPAWARRSLTVVLLLVCVAMVAGYQLSRPRDVAAEPRVFVPSPEFYEKLPESWRATVADAYWLYLIQYYGEHVTGDLRFDSLPELLDLVTTLSPNWTRPYLFGAYAYIDYGRPDLGYALLQQGSEKNPDDWRLLFNLGVFAYWFGDDIFPADADKDAIAAGWFEKAAAAPDSPPITDRLAAALFENGDDKAKAVNMWFQVYAQGDEYSRQKAIAALQQLLPTDDERRGAIAALGGTIPTDQMQSLEDELLAK